MAGTIITGDVVTFNSVAITHVTAWNLNVAGTEISQEVADSASALTAAGATVKSVTVSFVVPATGGATLLEALAEDQSGALTIVTKDGVGGTTQATWTAADSSNSSQGCAVAASAGSMTIGTVTISTNGGAWT